MAMAAVLCLPVATSLADEGMWLPIYLEKYNMTRMKQLGLELSAQDIFNNDPNSASLKDAIVLFGGGCTGEVISKQGLVLTNHHCGFGYIADHSTLQHNYLRDGFWAKSLEEELPNKRLSVTFVKEMHNVTDELLAGMDAHNLSATDNAAIKDRLTKLEERYKGKSRYRQVLVRPMFFGAEYYLYVIESYPDVRLVGAPPSGIGKFGGDTDNWEWPRHTGDFSLFRIYAAPDNSPAPYSKENVPYKPQQSLTISLQGVKPGDFTMVYGFPGRTQQYISSYQLKLTTDVLNKHKIALRTKRLEIIDAAMASSEELRLKYADMQAGIANAWKKWQGENKGVKKLDAIAMKQIREQKVFTYLSESGGAGISKNPKLMKLDNEFRRWTDSLEQVALPFEYFREAIQGNGLLAFAGTWRSALITMRDAKARDGRLTSLAGQIQEFYKERDPEVEQKLLAVCLDAYMKDLNPRWVTPALGKLMKRHKGDATLAAADLYSKSFLANEAKATLVLKALQTKMDTAKQWRDPAIEIFHELFNQYNTVLQSRYILALSNLEEANGLMLAARRASGLEGTTFYPDANSTLRVAYGIVDNYQPRDGVTYLYHTTLDGMMAKHNPKVEEFRAPDKLLQLYEAKDYGQYEVNGTVPLAFIASNHTTGGNSGSPVLDAKGRLIGTNFDRCWEGTMSDIVYNKDLCRNIVLDVRYTLFIIDKLGGASHLIKEMDIVR